MFWGCCCGSSPTCVICGYTNVCDAYSHGGYYIFDNDPHTDRFDAGFTSNGIVRGQFRLTSSAQTFFVILDYIHDDNYKKLEFRYGGISGVDNFITASLYSMISGNPSLIKDQDLLVLSRSGTADLCVQWGKAPFDFQTDYIHASISMYLPNDNPSIGGDVFYHTNVSSGIYTGGLQGLVFNSGAYVGYGGTASGEISSYYKLTYESTTLENNDPALCGVCPSPRTPQSVCVCCSGGFADTWFFNLSTSGMWTNVSIPSGADFLDCNFFDGVYVLEYYNGYPAGRNCFFRNYDAFFENPDLSTTHVLIQLELNNQSVTSFENSGLIPPPSLSPVPNPDDLYERSDCCRMLLTWQMTNDNPLLGINNFESCAWTTYVCLAESGEQLNQYIVESLNGHLCKGLIGIGPIRALPEPDQVYSPYSDLDVSGAHCVGACESHHSILGI